ncbi:Hsp33 family molecular chaperone HslO [Aliidiomarina iranensis]|uniref:33 kDa chaperonin n=1 Tax=Aliidiomarina iranensis TaxID=1434071 RepID=A0A432W351_9GAMM|nr:Hsp33 family molecular chaperone HslO [Aliidiomarina iranensis]RUO23624.1 Hsp33 family molecular chaperone HslO [Aliidiomarina iranensis]
MSLTQDSIARFAFTNHDVRGEIVRLHESYKSLLAGHDYPKIVQQLLGELMAVTSLLTATLKFEGHINVQIQGNDGPLNFATVNGSHGQALRGVARLTREPEQQDFRSLVGEGAYLVITLTPNNGEKYQGMVAIEGDSLAEAIESYFLQSEQLPTRIWLFADADKGQAAGLFLQVLPAGVNTDSSFEHVSTLASTITAEELFTLATEEVLHRLYHEETIELYPEDPVTFSCGCSRERTASALRNVSLAELHNILDEDGELRLTCDYCLTEYVYTRFDIDALNAHSAPEQTQ